MRTILISFEAEWFEKLENNEIKFEYRKNLPNEQVRVFFYVSSPVKAITGIAYFGEREILADWKLKFADRGQDVLDRIDDYLKDCRYVVPILMFQRTSKISLYEVRNDIPEFVVPRMYYYIENTELEKYLDERLKFEGQQYEPDFVTIENDDICC